ncbi:beta strand repeat-containing protein [Chlorogloea sp. CCALA 695]|uniref:beta strand repeat-containing protein n=1 Tax=Chlorogloea sp. CCALA 695 TaxID=2107693 RepID=UPI000D0794FE|nr:S-layer family protein [Chlorogloea sp. CCALA 695]PSB32986.1 hypothetical protein C7B70_08210 [Chlorogloea sp. CCALA 695]
MIAKSWLSGCWQVKIGTCVAMAGTFCIAISGGVLAQVVPDNTLGAESSIATPDVIRGIESDRIDGGATRGANLFHSFEQFNIGAERGAYFTNSVGIENIFSRVTGANSSEILGRLGVLGNANLFLINPRGIVFGSGASLDVQGSFIATTADAVKLGDTGLFSATQPEASNLLTVSPSAILFNTINAQSIVNRSQAQSSISQPNSAGDSPGLQVPPSRTLGLIGGDVLIQGGKLTAAGGRIELGSVAGVGQVSLIPNEKGFALGYDAIADFGNISLSNRASVDTSGEGGGDVQIRGARLEMSQNSNVWADTLGAENGGELLVRTTEVVLGEDSFLRANVTPTGMGTGGNLTINTGRLLVQGGAEVSATTSGAGKGGNLQISASESVEVVGESPNRQVGSGLLAQSEGSGGDGGDAGNLTIDTGRLLVRDGSQISASTGGEGKGGNLQIVADSVEMVGESAKSEFVSGLSAQSEGRGDAGNVTIETGRLLLQDGAQVSAITGGEGKGGNLQIVADSVEMVGESAKSEFVSGLFATSLGSGNAGNVTIKTGRLLVRDGAQVSAITEGEGKGGHLQIVAHDSVELIGTSANSQFASGLSVRSQGSGDSGNLTIDTGRLLVQGGAVISSRSSGEGTSGNTDITARETLQADDGTISTSTSRSGGGAIAIKAGNIRLVGDSDIRGNVASGADDGGNITLTADYILAFDNSDILAFARDGKGGDITLNTPAFFGENYRPAPGSTNLSGLDNNNQVDINATGAVSGIITIPDVTFIQNSLIELPENQLNTDSILANSCIVRRNQPTMGSFTITGTGGLPQRPGDAQISSFPTVDMATLPSDITTSNTHPNRSWQKGDPIIEPQGVYRLPNRKLVLSRECS